jgi:hypothetical protein
LIWKHLRKMLHRSMLGCGLDRLEALPKTSGRRNIQVITNDDYTFSLEVPTSMERPSKASIPCITSIPEMPQSSDHIKDDWESWEDEEFAPLETPPPSQTPSWHEDLSSLPREFPVLVVNLSLWSEDSQTDPHQAYRTLQQQLLSDAFPSLSEELFEKNLAQHASIATYERVVRDMEQQSDGGECSVSVFYYPSLVSGLQLAELVNRLHQETRWDCVNALKECVRRCNRDYLWKYHICIELEKLAERYEEKAPLQRQRLRALLKLRDSLEVQVEQQASSTPQQVHTTLGEVERRLLDLQSETDIDLDVIDRVLAMVLDRMAHAFLSEKEHYQDIAETHMYLRDLWREEFGEVDMETHTAEQPVSRLDSEEVRESDEEPDEEVSSTSLACVGGLSRLQELAQEEDDFFSL